MLPRIVYNRCIILHDPFHLNQGYSRSYKRCYWCILQQPFFSLLSVFSLNNYAICYRIYNYLSLNYRVVLYSPIRRSQTIGENCSMGMSNAIKTRNESYDWSTGRWKPLAGNIRHVSFATFPRSLSKVSGEKIGCWQWNIMNLISDRFRCLSLFIIPIRFIDWFMKTSFCFSTEPSWRRCREASFKFCYPGSIVSMVFPGFLSKFT